MQPDGRPETDSNGLDPQQERPAGNKNQLPKNVNTDSSGENPQIQSQQNIDHLFEIFPSKCQI